MKRIHSATVPACFRFAGYRGVSIIALAVVLMASVAGQAWGQWTCASGVCSTTNNVGIGTASPGGALQIANNGPEWSAFNFGTNLIIKDGTVARHPSIGLFDANNNNPWAVTNVYGDLWFDVMPVLGNTSIAPITQLVFKANGNVGIGTTNPLANLSVIGNIAQYSPGQATAGSPVGASLYLGDINFYNSSYYNSAPGLSAVYDPTTGVGGDLAFYTYNRALNSRSEKMRILASGNVGIGTTNPQNLLSVNGIIQAKEVLVNTGWSDYVFDPAYRLRPLSEVATYIRANHHLPDIPSQAEVEEKGISLGEMQSKLLAKVEELTLHMIEADERSRQAAERNKSLEHQNRELQERIARLEATGNHSNHQK